MSDKEQRDSHRRRIRLPMMCWEVVQGKIESKGHEIICRDLSAQGLAFQAPCIYPLGTIFHLEIHLPGRKTPILCKIKVVRIESLIHKDEYLIGSTFCELAEEDQKDIVTALEKMNLYNLLQHVLSLGASDLHLTVGHPPMIRLDGRILPTKGGDIEDGHVAAMIYPLLTSAQIEIFEKNKELDFAFSPTVDSRFRVNLHFQKGFLEAVFRSIPNKIKTFTELGLPVDVMEKFCLEKSGLILITGTTGAGKTTTMAALVDYINRTQERVIITIEDPIEYTLKSQKCIIKQRELGNDTHSYAEALKRTLRQDPDVICIGEILDGECLIAALRAAETGHLVISTVHAPDTVQAVERMVNFFPPEHAENICQQISSSLVGILYQLLIPTEKGTRVLATELLINNNAIRNLVREKRYSQIKSILQTGRNLGMYTLHSNLTELCEKGLISIRALSDYDKHG